MMKFPFIYAACLMSALVCEARNPNIVVILADDMGWGDVGYHGFEDVATPHIDKLAKSGTWFEQGYVTASVCGPSRAGLISGVYQQRFGFLGNGEKFIVPLDQPTLAERLKARGYTTGMLGKWHVGHEKEELPNARGFDFYYGSLTGSHDYFKSSTDPHEKKRALLPIYRNGEIEPRLQERGDNLTRAYGEEAVDFIGKNKDNPFFLYVAHNAVHYPWQAEDADIERLKKLKVHHEERRFFAAMVLALDDSVGMVMDALRKNGLERDTLVFFLSDNGSPNGQGFEQPRQKKRGETTMSSPGEWNGFKGDTYEGGIRVPFLMCWPGRVPAGESYPHPVSSLDIAATAMAVSSGPDLIQGLKLDGVSLIPYLTGRAKERPHDVMYWRRGDDYAVRKGDWKLVYNDGKPTGSEKIELFNLKNDPGEWNDLAGGQPERAQLLQHLFDEWDSAQPDSMAGIASPQNRNRDYGKGRRVDVAEFNSK
jgi:arylsulfatase A-like enzyme